MFTIFCIWSDENIWSMWKRVLYLLGLGRFALGWIEICWFICNASWFGSSFIWIAGNWLVCTTWWSPPSTSLISISNKISMIFFSAIILFLWLSLPSFSSTKRAKWVGCLSDEPGAMDSTHLVNSSNFILTWVVFRVFFSEEVHSLNMKQNHPNRCFEY